MLRTIRDTATSNGPKELMLQALKECFLLLFVLSTRGGGMWVNGNHNFLKSILGKKCVVLWLQLNTQIYVTNLYLKKKKIMQHLM